MQTCFGAVWAGKGSASGLALQPDLQLAKEFP